MADFLAVLEHRLGEFWVAIKTNRSWMFEGIGVAVLVSLFKVAQARRRNRIARIESMRKEREATASKNVVARQEFLHDLVSFCAESAGVASSIFHAKKTGDAAELSLSNLAREKNEADSQHLQLRATALFADSDDVQRQLFEYIRRTNLARVALMMAEKPYLDRAFIADCEWVAGQSRRLLSIAAQAAGYDLDRAKIPFMIGYHPSFVGDTSEPEPDGQPPSNRISEEYNLAKVRKEWEALGHNWDPSIEEARKARRAEEKQHAARLPPRRDSDPDVRGGVFHGIPFEERHHLWLAGYDSRPLIHFSRGGRCQLSARIVTQLREPAKAIQTFDRGYHPIDLISPDVSRAAADLLRQTTEEDFDRRRAELEAQLRGALGKNFEAQGYELVSLEFEARTFR